MCIHDIILYKTIVGMHVNMKKSELGSLQLHECVEKLVEFIRIKASGVLFLWPMPSDNWVALPTRVSPGFINEQNATIHQFILPSLIWIRCLHLCNNIASMVSILQVNYNTYSHFVVSLSFKRVIVSCIWMDLV